MTTQAIAADKYVDVNGLRLHYLDWANEGAVPLVMLHGLRGFAWTWDPVARPLADRFHVLALDQRGRGDSDWAPNAAYNTRAFVSDLEGMTAQLGIGHFVLLGHSMGGANTIVYASEHPDQVIAAAIEDMGPWPAGGPPPGIARIGRELEATPLTFASWAEAEALARNERPLASDESVKARLAATMRKLPDGRVGWKYDLDGIRKARGQGSAVTIDLWPPLKNIKCPTLVLRGERTDILARETAEEMARLNPLVRWVEVPGATHFVHEDNLEVFNREVARFLAEVV